MNDRSADFPGDYPAPHWLPDWKKENAYTDHGDDLQAWAWECLRRNPEYQAVYARWAALPDTDGNGSWSPKYGLTTGDWTPMRFCYADAPALSDDEEAGDYTRRTGCPAELLHLHYFNKWGLEALGDP